MIEIERTYLVKKVPNDLASFRSVKLRQGYLSEPPSPLRIRQRGEKFELTKKFRLRKSDLTTAEEINLSLTVVEFRKLWPLTIKSLEKTRYFIPLSRDLVAELDVFGGKLKGLVFVEVEFRSQKQMTSFAPPAWFGREITEETFSANVFLAGKTFGEIEKLLHV